MTTTVRGVTAAQARGEAQAAAQDATVRVARAEQHTELDAVSRLAERVWGPSKPLRSDLLQAVTMAGGSVLTATPADGGEVVGFAFGFLGWSPVTHLHSHMAAVLPGWRSSGVGFALKMAQRALCLDNDVSQVRWTFDPLMARNARFNLLRLGAHATGFLPDCYGPMGDAINGSDASDRLEVTWLLDRPVGRRPHQRTDASLVDLDTHGIPHPTGTPPRPGCLLPIPEDYPALRAAGDPRAAAWREVTGGLLSAVYDRGLVVAGLGPGGYLIDERNEAAA